MNQNQLQFAHHNTPFATREEAVSYINQSTPEFLSGLIGNPVVARYGTTPENSVMLLAIGNGTGYYFIDVVPVQNDLNALIERLEDGQQTAEAVISGLVNNMIYRSAGGGIASSVHSFSFDAASSTLSLSFENVTQVYTANIGKSVTGFDSITFNSGDDSMTIVYRITGGETVTVNVPISGLWDEWVVDNLPQNSVTLTKTLDVNNIYHLSGDTKIDTARQNNILQKDSEFGRLYVTGHSDNIKYGTGGAQQTLTTKIDSIQSDISSAVAAGVTSANEYTSTEITTEISNRNTAIAASLTSAKSYTDTAITTVNTSIASVETSLAAETTARQAADTSLQTQIDNLPSQDTHITSGSVSEDGENLYLYYGTAAAPCMGTVTVPTGKFMTNPDHKLRSGSVSADGQTMTLSYGTGATAGTISVDTAVLSGGGTTVVSGSVSNGAVTDPYSPSLVLTNSDESSVSVSFSSLAGSKGVDAFDLAVDATDPYYGNLKIKKYDGTEDTVSLTNLLNSFPTNAALQDLALTKQDVLTAGTNISIVDNVISAILSAGVSSVTAGAGMNFTPITQTGAVALGTPSTVSGDSVNSVTGTTHTHALLLPFEISDYPTENEVEDMIDDAIEDISGPLKNNVIKGITVSDTGSNLVLSSVNLETNAVTSATLMMPIADDTRNGYMPFNDHVTIQELVSDVNTLKNLSGRFIGISFPTLADLKAYVIPSTVQDGDFTYVLDDEDYDGAITRYVYDEDATGTFKWEYTFTVKEDPVGIATTTTPGIVLSSEAAGQVYVETDGTMSLVGYDSITGNITAVQTNVSGLKDGSVSAGNAVALKTERAFSVGGDIRINGSVNPSFNGTAALHMDVVYNKIATSQALGVVKVGTGLSVDPDGLLTATGEIVAESVLWANVTGKPFDAVGSTLFVTTMDSTKYVGLQELYSQTNSYNSGVTVDKYGRISSALNIPIASSETAGLMSASQAVSLSNLASGAMLKSEYTNVGGNVAKADKLSVARQLTFSNGATGQGVFDGTDNVTIALTLAAGDASLNSSATTGKLSVNTSWLASAITFGTLNTTSAASLVPSTSESFSSEINLHKVSKTGKYEDLTTKPDLPWAMSEANGLWKDTSVAASGVLTMNTATSSSFGTVKTGSGITNTAGTISVETAGTATAGNFGIVKTGSGIKNTAGTISVETAGTATAGNFGIVKTGDGITNVNGLISVNDTYINDLINAALTELKLIAEEI
jgi:hypothetical protein